MEDEFDESSELNDAPSNDGSGEEKQSVSSDLIRGHINTIILRSLYDGDKYGYEIISEIERKSHGQYSLKQPSLYSALKRLEKDGYITSYWGGSVSGGRRKYFSLTETGRTLSEQNQSEWEYSRTVIDSLISDKDFDFSNPAPVAVDMRVLRDTTTRARTSGFNDEEHVSSAERERLEREFAERKAALEERCSMLEAEIARITEERYSEVTSSAEKVSEPDEERENSEEERAALAEASTKLEEAREAFEEEFAKFELEKKRYEEEMEARNDALLREREWREHEIAERERNLEEEKKSIEANRPKIGEDEFRALQDRLREREEELSNQREHYEEEIRSLEREAEEERSRNAKEMALREQQIIEEQETLFRQREQQLLHQNYLDLIASPLSETSKNEYNYYSAPVGETPVEEPAPTQLEEKGDDYRTVVRQIYAKSVNPETQQPAVKKERTTSLDGIDFHDLEALAAQDGIRVYTAGGKSRTMIAETSASVIHKGKALFISSVVLFAFLIVLGVVLFCVRSAVSLPLFYPFLIWAVAIVVLLVCGLAYANKYGERSLRGTTPAIIHAVVLFLLLSIVTLIVALGLKIDFTEIGALTTYVIVPIVFFFGVIVFGFTYYMQTRPKRY